MRVESRRDVKSEIDFEICREVGELTQIPVAGMSVSFDGDCLLLGIEGKKVVVCKTKSGERKIKARAVWYDQMKCKIQDGDDVASI